MENTRKICNELIKGIRDYFKKNKIKKAVIGLSGGLDSSVTCALAVKAIGKENVTGLLLPEFGITSKESIKDAGEIVNLFKIRYFIRPINDFLKPFKTLKWNPSKIALGNTKARIRANILYNFANTNKALVVGTSNKSEIVLGYFTKYGDAASDIIPIGDLWKSEVIEIAKFLKIPKKIIDKKPTAELFPGQTDEAELGAPYKVLDKICKLYLEENKSPNEIEKTIKNKPLVNKVIKKIKDNEHKRKPAELILVSGKSFLKKLKKFE